jgi:hypothetical protein
MYKYFCLIEHVSVSCSFIEVSFHCFKNEAFSVASLYDWYLYDFLSTLYHYFGFFSKASCRFLYKNDTEIAAGYVDTTSSLRLFNSKVVNFQELFWYLWIRASSFN